MREAQEQQALFQWAAYQKGKEYQLLYHIPNGGKRDVITAVRLKAEGVKAGVPDLFLPVARKHYHGFYIELKAGKNKPTYNQIIWLRDLAEQGYKCAVCYGWQQAAEEIKKYLEGK